MHQNFLFDINQSEELTQQQEKLPEFVQTEDDKPKKGKECPQCKKLVGCRSNACKYCNWVFIAKVEQGEKPKENKVKAKKGKPLKNPDPVYEAMRLIADEISWHPTSFELLDPGEGNFNKRAEIMYQLRLNEFRAFVKELQHKAYEKILVAKYKSHENDPYGWEETAEKIHFSISQRTQPAAGSAVRDLFCYFLKLASVEFKIEVDGIDVFIAGLLETSVKHSMRDRENDKDHHIQVFYKAEARNKMWQLFKNNNAIVIVLDPISREDRARRLEKKGIALTLHSLDDGITQIKKLLEEHEQIDTTT